MGKRVQKHLRLSIKLIVLGCLVAITLNLLFPFRPNIEYSPIILADDQTLLSGYLTADDKWRMYTTLEEITPQLKKAIIFKEDRLFYYHFGINPLSILRAAFNNVVYGKRTSGASTITMQVARLVEPKRRTYLNKVIEIFRAFQLEWNYSKDEILQLYLNLVPYGGNLEGVKSASVMYFNKMPDHLSLAQVTMLSIVPNRPTSLRPGSANPEILEQRNAWLQRFGESAVFSQEEVEDALDEPLTARRRALKKNAPHLSRRLKNAYGSRAIVTSTVDLNTQLKSESIVGNYIKRLRSRNVKNAAVLVIENETMHVKAYVGSADYYDPYDGGQVDGVVAVRSPGSTLKPFLYGLAFDQGLVTPSSMIADVPVNFSGYQPQNYQETFNGNVTVKFALANSLNIPAVKVLDIMRPHKFVKELSSAGFVQIKRDKDHLGLSTVLGGCGVTLEELTRLYASFANGGQMKPIQFLASDSSDVHKTVLSEASSFMISEILTDVVRPDLPAVWKNTEELPKVAWKTGTSYGRRDAWSIGFNKKYTIGVWVGNFSGEGVQELTGTEMAAPLLFQLFNAIDRASGKEWFKMPKGVNFRYTCTESGAVPNSFCETQALDYFLPGISDYQKCQHKKSIYISPDSTQSYCTTCLPENGYKKALYPNHTPELLSYFDTEKINYIKIPHHNPDCERVFSAGAPKITSPIDRLEYFVDKSDTLQLALSCQAANNVDRVFWYVNDKFYQSAFASETVYLTPKDGELKISCTDDKGRNSNVTVDVKKVRF